MDVAHSGAMSPLSQHEGVHEGVRAIMSARLQGGWQAHHLLSPSSIISAGVGGTYWFITLICNRTPRQSRQLPDVLKTQGVSGIPE